MVSVVDKKPPLTGYQKVSGSDEAAATVVITSGSDNSHTPTLYTMVPPVSNLVDMRWFSR